mmetsp:Transcript_34562/g.75664  ORF Transcript_34562/g.75664 Transcript_34562/m.75664 type:complete len:173 (-) Transcript_34562:154-672(-)|eukprot:CAMPEP_0178497486 /NCGR_PEP_ID=MMETSP0696-20121128/14715_1 /TAXON_ID=265572 /ORGANISM="Extubocellulus spinifer, Strain CCMP396" /LENGTH=172 /DNA_ID=CAMNT_0020125917 /DNA_START=315 /DNA_END=833 /DNA_ORIENTATION=-
MTQPKTSTNASPTNASKANAGATATSMPKSTTRSSSPPQSTMTQPKASTNVSSTNSSKVKTTAATKSTPQSITGTLPPTAVRVSNVQTRTLPPPPPGAPPGGRWGTIKYSGDKTNMMCIILCLAFGIFSGFGTCAYLCPMDEMDGYKVGGVVYDFRGNRINMANKEFSLVRK